MPERFADDLVDLLRDVREMRIETCAADGAPVHRTIVWPIVDDRGRLLVRSYRGPTARWYREALANSSVAILLDDRHIDATALVATDDDRIESATRGYLSKYRASSATPAMVAHEVLSTTLELVPR